MIIALDFDGTLVKHAWPEIGEDLKAVPHLKSIQQAFPKVRYMLWTVRSGDTLCEAIQWCFNQGLILWSVNCNPDQSAWSTSGKAHAHCYVDDTAVGAPLIYPGGGARPYIDWSSMGPLLLERVEYYFRYGG